MFLLRMENSKIWLQRSFEKSFDYMFDLSMLDDWEDNLVDIAWGRRLADCQEQEVKKEDKSVHVGAGPD